MEGAEKAVFFGAQNTIRSSLPFIMFEVGMKVPGAEMKVHHLPCNFRGLNSLIQYRNGSTSVSISADLI